MGVDREEDGFTPPSSATVAPEYRLSENPDFLQLVSTVEQAYEKYIAALSAAIKNVEDKPKLEEEIAHLEDPHYDASLRAQTEEYNGTRVNEALERMRATDIQTHIYGIKDWHAVLSAIWEMKEHFEKVAPSGRINEVASLRLGLGDSAAKAEIAALFEKTNAANTKIFRNLSKFPDKLRKSDALPIEALNSFPNENPITPFTPREWELLMQALNRKLDQQRKEAEQKIAEKETRLGELRSQIVELEREKPKLLAHVETEGEKLAPLATTLNQQMDEEHGRVKPIDHATLQNPKSYYWDSFQSWKREILGRAIRKLRGSDLQGGLYRSLENQLGFASNNNHFDVFFIDDSGRRISNHHVHAVLDIKLFLALANGHFDVEIFKGEQRSFESYEADGRTADFSIPKNGILQAGILRN